MDNEERLERIERKNKKQDRQIRQISDKIDDLKKVLIGSFIAITVFLYSGYRTIELGEKELGFIIQVVGIIAGGGVAATAANKTKLEGDDDLEDE
jgi:hypothetical protein